MPPVPPYLSLCMIVRDSAATIENLLDSVVRGEHGPAYDEYVFVDTGSEDDTRARISAALGDVSWPTSVDSTPTTSLITLNGIPVRVVLARFTWINDFSAARQYSFELATGRWRMFLDADDVAPTAYVLRDTLADIEKRSPPVNAISMTYDYDSALKQDVVRCVRWADGWRWIRPIHESLARSRSGDQRVISKLVDFTVNHRPPEGHFERSITRNHEILLKSHAFATKEGDIAGAARDAFSLGQYHRSRHEFELAAKYYQEAGAGLGSTNLAAMALTEYAEMMAVLGQPDLAVDAAAVAFGRAPELREGIGALAIAHRLRGDLTRAVNLFDLFFSRPLPFNHTAHDILFLDGVVPAHAALAYLDAGQDDKAEMALSKVHNEAIRDKRVQPLVRVANRVFLQRRGIRILKEMHDFWNWSCEPIKFRRILQSFLPESIAELPEITEIKEWSDKKLPHLDGWEEYKKAYADIPSDTFHTSEALRDHVRYNLGRTKGVVAWAKAQPVNGPPIYVAAIGAQDCLIEEEMLKANPRIHLCAIDVSPTAAEGIQRVIKNYPGRVSTHAIVTHHYDWPLFWPGTENKFDVVTLFEVIEHVPDDDTALWTMRLMLKPNGTLFLSTPIAYEWIEPYLTGPMPPWHFHGHVRGYSPTSLWRKFRAAGFTGNLSATDNKTLFFAEMTPTRQWPSSFLPQKKLTILCPWTPIPFDPKSLHEGHVGGSEEAVIRLAPKLAEKGVIVTVYAGMPDREDRIHVVDGVRWRPTTEFNPAEDHGTVLLWRSPQTLLQLGEHRKKFKTFAWMHDLAAGAPPEAYEACEKAIVLSETAVDEVIRLDHVPPEKIVVAQNGIDGSLFPPITNDEGREPHTCIWASSPNRGLQHLLAIWPKVRESVPDAKLEIYYDWTMFRNSYPTWAKDLDDKIEALKDHGVKFIGGVSHDVLFRAYRRVGIFAFPSTYVETFCTNAALAQAGGAWPVVTYHGALRTTVIRGDFVAPISWDTNTSDEVKATEQYAKYPDPEGSEEYLKNKREEFQYRFLSALVNRLRNPPTAAEREEMRSAVIEQFDWKKTANRFYEIMYEKELTKS